MNNVVSIEDDIAPFLSERDRLRKEAIEKHKKILEPLYSAQTVFGNLMRKMYAENPKEGPINLSMPLLKRFAALRQAVCFAFLFPLEGNIRSGNMELRFIIESACATAYVIGETDEYVELENKAAGKKNSKTVDDKIRKKSFSYVEETYPEESKKLKNARMKINCLSGHIRVHQDDLDQGHEYIEVAIFDSETVREHLPEQFDLQIDVYYNSSLLICKSLNLLKGFDATVELRKIIQEKYNNYTQKRI